MGPRLNLLDTSNAENTFPGFPTRMVYFYHISCLRYTILVGNPRYEPNSFEHVQWNHVGSLYVLSQFLETGTPGAKISMAIDTLSVRPSVYVQVSHSVMLACNGDEIRLVA